jgi:hypothetical protein
MEEMNGRKNATPSLNNGRCQMKKMILPSLVISLLVVVFVPGNTKMGSEALAKPQAHDAALLMCVADPVQSAPPSPRSILVHAFSTSANVRAATPGTDCAQALADLFKAGFQIQNVQPLFNTNGSFFTLTK